MNGVNGVAGSVAVLGAEAAQVLGVSQLGVEVAVHFTLARRQTADRVARRLIQGHVLSFLRAPHLWSGTLSSNHTAQRRFVYFL